MNLLEIQDKKNQLEEERNNLIETGKKEERKLNDKEETRFNEINTEIENLDTEKRKIEEENKREIQNNNNKINTDKRMNFKLINAINDVIANRSINEDYSEILKRGRDAMTKAGLNVTGQIQIPVEDRAAIVATNSTNVATDVYSIVEPLRNNLVLAAAGAQFLTGLIGDVEIPSYTGTNVTWEGETADAKDGAGTFSGVKLQPKRLTAYVDVSKQFLAQDSNSAEMMLQNDIVKAIAEKLEATVFGDAAATNSPEGLFYSGATTISGVTYSSIVDLESAIEDKKIKNYSFILSNKAKAKLKKTAINSTRQVLEDGEVDGYPTFVTPSVVSNGVVVGDFTDYVVGQWASIDITVDPYTQAAAGKVRLVVNAYFDAKPRRDAFVKAILA